MIFDQKWQFSTEFEMIPTYRQGTFQPFSSEKWILAKIYGFSKKIGQNGAKINKYDSEYKKGVLLSNSRIGKSHQIKPI